MFRAVRNRRRPHGPEGQRWQRLRLGGSLTEGSATIEAITFDATVVGTSTRAPPRVAVSFFSAADATLAVGSIRVDAKAVTLPEASVTL